MKISPLRPSEYEESVRLSWEKEKIYDSPNEPDGKKEYVLVMFPYPSGAGLHVGHVRVYTGTDVLARYFRMIGRSVLHPMGWDAFGLPAENAAIKAKTNPKQLVPNYIKTFKRQDQMLGLSYDWSREFATIDPSYYRFTQWLFITFFRMGLLYKKNTLVYFCEFCKTGLAEEEVLPDGTHERCQKSITRKELPQWMFRITSYADRLEQDLEGLDWPNGILQMQKNWIGRKEGINITYQVFSESTMRESHQIGSVICFTTRPDTNFGATFVVVAPEHSLASGIIDGSIPVPETACEAVKRYVTEALSKTDVERQTEGRKKTGVFTGLYARNDLTGRAMPVWVSDFVLSSVGTGAVVGVPGHDVRDFEFAREFGLDVLRVVAVDGDDSPITDVSHVQEDFGEMVNSGFLNGMPVKKAIEKMKQHLVEKGWGERVVSYHLRDWIFSRQRYWGEPIPMVHCLACEKKGISWWDTEEGREYLESVEREERSANKTESGIARKKAYQNIINNIKLTQESVPGWFPIDQKSLPLELPDLESYEPDGTGRSPLAQSTEWAHTSCPHCKGAATRETDTMPNWAGSCWYFLYFAIPEEKRAEIGFGNENVIHNPYVRSWLPVDWYLGGAEHAVLHLLYSRFWVKALYDLGYVTFREPFTRLRTVGIVLAEDHRKMSKSWGNVINPDDVIAEYGADALRVYEMFMAPFHQEIAWSTSSLAGSYRFLKRIWRLYHTDYGGTQKEPKSESDILVSDLSRTILKVGSDIANIKFNTAVAAMMEFLNTWEKMRTVKKSAGLSKKNAGEFLKILAPFAPFLADHLWLEVLGMKGSIHTSPWPEADTSVMVKKNVQIPVQVSGKVRAVLTIPSHELDEDSVRVRAESEPAVRKYLEGTSYEVVYIKGRILNFVLSAETVVEK